MQRGVHRRWRLEERLGHRFASEALLERALTHRSAGPENNERLEFLGDAVLNFLVAELLCRRFPQAREGLLTRARAQLVRRCALAGYARTLELGAELKLGEGEVRSGGRDRDSMLADAFEALVGAYYLDAGLEPCRRWLLELLEEHLVRSASGEALKDPKTSLQETLQARGLPRPVYSVTSMSGAAHQRTFIVSCEVSGLAEPTQGTGRSRREAEQSAARRSLELLLGGTRR